MITLPSSASPLEVGWTCTGLVGGIAVIYTLLRWVTRLRQAYDTKTNGRVRLQLWKNVAIDVIILLAEYVIVVVGILAMVTPPPARDLTTPSAVSIALGLGLMFLAVAFMSISVINLVVWEVLVRMTPTARERVSDRSVA